MPGGPIDPEKIFTDIRNGASVPSGGDHFTSPDRWPRVDGGAWEMADALASRITYATCEAIRGATLDGLYLIVGSVRHELAEVNGFAMLVPA